MTQDIDVPGASPAWLAALTGCAGLLSCGLLAWWALDPPLQHSARPAGFAPRPLAACEMDRPGFLRGSLYGAVEQELDWTGADMRCDGMRRPEGRGIRLVFDEYQNETTPGLIIVIGLADAELGKAAEEIPANVTIINQVTGDFFSTREEPRCWTTLTEQLQLSGTIEETWRIDGQLYCASALAALAGPGSVTLGDIEFSGIFKPGPY